MMIFPISAIEQDLFEDANIQYENLLNHGSIVQAMQS
jgi:hypothetical protein